MGKLLAVRLPTFGRALCVLAAMLISASPAHAGWSSVTGRIIGVSTYYSSNVILFSLDNQPTTPLPPGCTTMGAFAIDGTLPVEKRQMMMAQLLTAQAARMLVNVTWADDGGCIAYDSTSIYPRVVRLTPMSN